MIIKFEKQNPLFDNDGMTYIIPTIIFFKKKLNHKSMIWFKFIFLKYHFKIIIIWQNRER